MPVNVPGFYVNKQFVTTSSVSVSSLSSRKAGEVAIYRNINNFTDCNWVNVGIDVENSFEN